MMGVSGCMNGSKIANEKSLGEKVLAYMEKKYNEKFDYIGSTDGGFDTNNRTLLVSPRKDSDIQIDVSYRKIDSNEEYAENYTQIKYKDKTKNFIANILNEIFEVEAIVDYEYGCSVNDFNELTSFEQFVKNEESAISFYAVISPEYNNDDTDKIKQLLKERCEKEFSYCRCNIYFARTKDEYISYYELPVWKIDEMRKIQFGIGE